MSSPIQGDTTAYRAAEQAARNSYGRLVAYLASRSRDLAAAEDAVGEAFRKALESWPREGVPDRPDAWLLTVARRELIDGSRREKVHDTAEPFLRLLAERRQAEEGSHDGEESDFPDERLKLLIACAHPSIDAAARTPLMLQSILGLDAARIASAFLVSPTAMSQRLVRAKAKIRSDGVPFDLPPAETLPERLPSVLEAIYAAYGRGWEDAAGADPRQAGLAEESLHLARILADLAPGEPEALGLLALLLHCEARREARRSPTGDYVPLARQDASRWSRPMIAEAERRLAEAAGLGRIGRFQLEAAIQSAHAERAFTETTDWEAISTLYDGLVALHPTLGARVSRAAALANSRGPAEGLRALNAIDPTAVADYQPFWAVRAHLLADLGDPVAADEAYEKAMGLSEDPKVREFLIDRRASLGDGMREAGSPGAGAGH